MTREECYQIDSCKHSQFSTDIAICAEEKTVHSLPERNVLCSLLQPQYEKTDNTLAQSSTSSVVSLTRCGKYDRVAGCGVFV